MRKASFIIALLAASCGGAIGEEGVDVALRQGAAALEVGDPDDPRTDEQRRDDAAQEAQDLAALEALVGAPEESLGAADEDQELDESISDWDDGITEEDALAYLRSTDEESFNALAVAPFRVRGCWYFLSTPVVPGARPPRYQLTLRRMRSLRCRDQSMTYDTSYRSTALATTKESKGIVLAFASKQTPSGSALTHLRLFHISPKTMAIVRRGFLGSPRSSTFASEMHFEGNRLIVRGTGGTFPGQIGSGPYFTAVFPRFLTSTLPPVIYRSN